jgi:hypothetical protein
MITTGGKVIIGAGTGKHVASLFVVARNDPKGSNEAIRYASPFLMPAVKAMCTNIFFSPKT